MSEKPKKDDEKHKMNAFLTYLCNKARPILRI
jgi:hypothetical protein